MYRAVPLYRSTHGGDALAVAEMAGLTLAGWQRQVILDSMGVDGGQWTAAEVAVIGPPPGLNTVLLARALAGVFLLGERVLYTTPGYDAAGEAFEAAADAVSGRDMFSRRIRSVRRHHGAESIVLLDGARLLFAARENPAGRGVAADCLILAGADQATGRDFSGLLPCVASRRNPQIWFAGDEHAGLLATIRERLSRPADAAGLAVFDWAEPLPAPAGLPGVRSLVPAAGPAAAEGGLDHQHADRASRAVVVGVGPFRPAHVGAAQGRARVAAPVVVDVAVVAGDGGRRGGLYGGVHAQTIAPRLVVVQLESGRVQGSPAGPAVRAGWPAVRVAEA